MKPRCFQWILPALVLLVSCRHNPAPHALAGTPGWQPDDAHLNELKNEETNGNGIEVGAPKIYDDASLRMMLDTARNQLASLSGLQQASLTQSIGAVSGTRISHDQVGVQVSGPSAPAAAAPTAQAAPAAPSAAAPSSLDVLNEQMQLSSEISGLQLLLEGALSDRLVKNQRFVKPRATIGFPISLRAPARYRNAAAVVEVEVKTAAEQVSDQPDPPAITALLPREKTYNVAAMKSRTTSIGGGAVVGAVGVSGSWARGRTTLYLVKDQDTVALARPRDPNRPNVTSFLWEFRPVLGQEYVRGGMKQTFVQLSMPVLNSKDCFGTMRIRTYWRRFDQKQGVTQEVIEGSVLASSRNGEPLLFPIPRYDLTPSIDGVDYQDLGDGTVLVSVAGRFLQGVFVRLGPTRYDAGSGLIVEEKGVRFVAPVSALARWTGQVVARSGDRADLLDPAMQKKLPSLAQTACVSEPAREVPAAPAAPSAAASACENGSLKILSAVAKRRFPRGRCPPVHGRVPGSKR